jgi:hypothetical protein
MKHVEDALSAVCTGNLVSCTAEEYKEIRDALQDQAGRWIDAGDGLRAMIALEEVKRLDNEFGV